MSDKYNHWLGKLLAKINKQKRYAITLGQTAYYSCSESEVSIEWRKHEDCHRLQWKREGYIKFSARYIWQLFTKGYKMIDYEVEARKASEL